MPIYEYHCADCQERVNVFFRSFAETQSKVAVCPLCGGANLARAISKVTLVSGGGVAAGQPVGPNSADKSDPAALAKTMRQAGQGKDFGSEFKEVTRRLESGEKPASVEQSLRKRAGQKPQPH
jgi:putative FmdB family regulatory protein